MVYADNGLTVKGSSTIKIGPIWNEHLEVLHYLIV